VDLVLALGDELAELLIRYGDAFFGDIPLVLVTSETETLPRDLIKPNMTSLVWGRDLGKTMTLIQDLLPRTKHLFIISGTSMTDFAIRKVALKELRKSGVRIFSRFCGKAMARYLIQIRYMPCRVNSLLRRLINSRCS
jgi:hypothetical protein